ncbi:MAG: triphosphoribosyl-dephospho-CoA synthase [Anaerorhabdus sp.]
MIKNNIINLAFRSLIEEVSLAPKPGLVDPFDNGSHTDMNFPIFIDSCTALRDGFSDYFDVGQNHTGSLRDLFDSVRVIGKNNEDKMFLATNNINTHKGANFMFGIIISLIAKLDFPSLIELQEGIKEMTNGLVERELSSLKEFRTHGEKMYQKYNITGIRGEVEAGIPLAFDVALKIIQEEKVDYPTRLKQALLKLISLNDDANMVKRGGIEGLNFGKQLSCAKYKDLDQHLNYMNKEFIKKSLSPGGSADILAVAIFLNHYNNLLVGCNYEKSFSKR